MVIVLLILVVVLIVYFVRKKRSENPITFPRGLVIFLVILLGISLIGSVIYTILRSQNDKYLREHYSEIMNGSNRNSYSTNELDFNGLTFSYPDNWKIEKEVLQENLGFQVNCEKKGLSSNIISIVWLRGTNFGSTTEMAENGFSGICEEMSAYNVKINAGEIYKCLFKGCDAVCLDYNFTLFGEKVYGKLSAFIMNDNTVVITKQSDTKDKLNTEFQVMEESFNLKSFAL